MVSMAGHHAEWLSLMDVSGPFLSVPVLKDALPNGLDAHDPQVAAEVRAALEQWADPDLVDDGSTDSVEVHLAFVRFVLHEVLGFDSDVLRWDDETVGAQRVDVPHHGSLIADAVVVDRDEPLMLVSVYGPGVRVDEIVPELGTATPQELMVEHLKATGLRVGLVTDGERWTLVSYQEGENPGFATWWSSLWGEERITLQAFRTLLGQDRFLALGEDETISALLDRSAEDQREVTTKLGNQTLDAVEILIRTIDRIDQERGGDLLREVEAEKGIAELYDAAVTVMMRLIFLFYAEENELLPMSEPLYVERYAASSLRERLQASADEHGEEVLESTHDGWPRLLATWRAVYGGVEHGDMFLAPYGGSLFDPDRYPFLEGRQPDSSWIEHEADPLPIDNRTVLHLLNALQTLDEGGQRRKLSFRALDVEQIGHVYEGMLDHTAARAEGWVLGLSGAGGNNPEIELDVLDGFDEAGLINFLSDATRRDKAATRARLARGSSPEEPVRLFGGRWIAQFGTDQVAAERASRFASFVRRNSSGEPTIFQPGSVYVADSAHRSATGTHYTPRALTEEIVVHALSPLVYQKDTTSGSTERILRSSAEILDLAICDPACGSGAFLVQACRFLAARLVDARFSEGAIPEPNHAHFVAARRDVAERCLHGVDVNPMACEMAKLSLWLTTMSKDRPFSFLDHAIKCGDALLGISDLDQLVRFDLGSPRATGTQLLDLSDQISGAIEDARELYRSVRTVSSESAAAVESKAWALQRAEAGLAVLRTLADDLADTSLRVSGARDRRETLEARRFVLAERLAEERDLIAGSPDRPALHWPLEFPHLDWPKGFDAVVANPPFLGSQEMTSQLGSSYRAFLVEVIADDRRGKADLVGYFALRFASLARSAGFLATNSICQGDTLDVCLRPLVPSYFNVARAWRSSPWPNSAGVFISKIWLTDQPVDTAVLEGEDIATAISAELYALGRVEGTAQPLQENDGIAHQGYQVIAAGLQVEGVEAEGLLADPESAPFVRPYVNGSSLHANGPGYKPGAYCIDFGTLTEAEARRAKSAFALVESRAKKEVLDKGASYASWKSRWWQFWSPRPELRRALAGLDQCLAMVGTSKVFLPKPVDTTWCLTHALVVFATDSWADFAILSSSHHWWWAVNPPGTGGSSFKSDPRYTASVSFMTFPRPAHSKEVEESGVRLREAQRAVEDFRSIGLKAVTNLVNDQSCLDDDVVALRDAYVINDQLISRSYRMPDLEALDLGHGFYDCGQLGTRFTIAAAARRHLIDCLLEENLRRFANSSAGKGSKIEVTDGVVRLRLRNGSWA